MASKKRGLNKGLDALLADTLGVAESPVDLNGGIIQGDALDNGNNLLEIEVTCLNPGRFQPRKDIQEKELSALADSIRSQGLLQPIVVRKITSDQFEIIAGERRWRAAQLAGMSKVPVILKDVSDKAAAAIGIVENIQREDLNPLEEAVALEKLSVDFSLTHSEVAEAVGKSRTSVTNLLRLMNLEADVKMLLGRSEIDVGHAKVLLALQGKKQSKLAKIVVDKKLSVRETEQLVAKEQSFADGGRKSAKPIDPDIKRLQNKLSEKLGSIVKIVHSNRGKGKVIIQYNNLDELDGILEHIN